jgi:tellurite resistance protein
VSDAMTHHDALIHTMVLVSAADRDMSEAEIQVIGSIITNLPVFRDFDRERLAVVARNCAEGLSVDDGLDRTLDAIADALPDILIETAYALACDVAAADLVIQPEEARILEMIRHRLGIERLAAAAIERGARARHMTIDRGFEADTSPIVDL